MEKDIEHLMPLFEEFLNTYKLVNRKNVADILRAELKTAQQIEVYQLTDGTKSTREVSAALTNKCAHVTVGAMWRRWALVGIVTATNIKGRFKAAFNLEEYGIADISEGE